ncbi:MAG: hypothetical protein JXR46_00220 [Calditrichaceae bacterium]|nr:hypothetical protein [Calditrichaceae bacterium]MBN2707437.1 hypothetical protein [Calditrichaceae bacterium]RQV94005.1 MAG: hypothetical protein EH224_11215 [Calditrichota bacterium]
MKWMIIICLLPVFAFSFDLDDWRSITNMNDVYQIDIYNQEVWAATTGGIYKYNQNSGEVQKFTNIEGLSSTYTNAIIIDAHGIVITGGIDGMVDFYNPADNSWDHSFKLQGNPIADFVIGNDSLWIASGKGVGIFIREDGHYEFRDYFHNFPVIINEVTSVHLFANRIWLGTDRGLLTAPSDINTHTINNPEEWSIFTSQNNLPGDKVQTLAVINDMLWIGLNDGLALMDEQLTITKMNNWGEGSAYTVKAITPINDEVLIGNNRQLYRYTINSGRSLIRTFDSNINDIKNLGNSDYVVANSTDGLFFSPAQKRFKLDGPSQNITRFTIRDHSGQIWATANMFKKNIQTGFDIKTADRWISHQFSPGRWIELSCSNILYEDRYNNIWIGSWGGGIMVFKADGDTVYFHGYDYPGNALISTFDSFESRDQSNAEVYHNFLSPAPTDAANYEVVTAFRQDEHNNLWIGCYYPADGYQLRVTPYRNGFVSINENDWDYYSLSNGIADEDRSISSMDFDFFGVLYCGTYGDGVYALNPDNKKISTLTIDDGLYTNSILSVAVDKDGIVWIGTAAGLNSYDGLNVYKHTADETGQSGPLENRINFIFIDEFNNRWFATSGGLSILKADHSPWETNAWVGYTTSNSKILSNEVNGIYVDSKSGEALIATERGLSVFSGSFAQIRSDYNQVSGGPNPFILGEHQQKFTITNLKKNSMVKIFTINGVLVRELSTESDLVEGSRAIWDGLDFLGKPVSSGVYLYAAFDEEGSTAAGKIAVIRK